MATLPSPPTTFVNGIECISDAVLDGVWPRNDEDPVLYALGKGVLLPPTCAPPEPGMCYAPDMPVSALGALLPGELLAGALPPESVQMAALAGGGSLPAASEFLGVWAAPGNIGSGSAGFGGGAWGGGQLSQCCSQLPPVPPLPVPEVPAPIPLPATAVSLLAALMLLAVLGRMRTRRPSGSGVTR